MTARPVRPQDLRQKVHNLNTRHDLNPGEPGFITLQTWRNNHSTQYRIMIHCPPFGDVAGSLWMKGSDLLAHLREKNWRTVLTAVNGRPKSFINVS